MKTVQIRSFFWSVFCCAQCQYRKVRTRNNSVFRHFSRIVMLFILKFLIFRINEQTLKIFTLNLIHVHVITDEANRSEIIDCKSVDVHGEAISFLQFSNDGKFLLCSCDDTSILLLQVSVFDDWSGRDENWGYTLFKVNINKDTRAASISFASFVAFGQVYQYMLVSNNCGCFLGLFGRMFRMSVVFVKICPEILSPCTFRGSFVCNVRNLKKKYALAKIFSIHHRSKVNGDS